MAFVLSLGAALAVQGTTLLILMTRASRGAAAG